jgi:perosamine synthetase
VTEKLALHGGRPLRQSKIPISLPDIGDEEIEEVTAVLRSGWITEGSVARDLENVFAEMTGCRYAVATSSGTAALHLLVHAIGVRPGQKVAVPSFTFIASANSAAFTGADPVFVEVDPKTYNMDPDHLRSLLRRQEVAAVVVPDLFGQPADYGALIPICLEYGLPIIEDAAEAHFSSMDNQRAGTFGNAAAFSFYPTKTMTTGEGGMITTDDPWIAERCRKIKNHGRLTVNEDHELLGYTYRMSDVLAAIGVAQLRKVMANIDRRRTYADRYLSALKEIPGLIPPSEAKGAFHTYMNYVVRVNADLFGMSRDSVVQALNAEGVGSKIYFDPPCHLQPYYRERYGYAPGHLPVSEMLSKQVFALPMHPRLTEQDVNDVIAAVRKVATAAKEREA